MKKTFFRQIRRIAACLLAACAVSVASMMFASCDYWGEEWYKSGCAICDHNKGNSGGGTTSSNSSSGTSTTTVHVSYNLNGGTNSASNTATFTIGDTAVTLDEPTRTGYTFLGWFTGDGTKVTSLDRDSAASLTLSAKWLPEGFVRIAAGSFTMGKDSDAHSVTLTRDFYICDHEVTQAEYLAVKGSNPSYFTGDTSRPVEKVSWYDAVDYCNRLSENEGLTPCYTGSGSSVTCDFTADGYRLPTDAEWEYAARAGDTTTSADTWSGTSSSSSLGDYVWYSANASSTTHPVKSKQPNANGLYDMSGNANEWCWDWYAGYSGAATDPTGPSSGSYRVVHGGSWNDLAYACAVTFRFGNLNITPNTTAEGLGFRVVRTAP